MRMRIISALGQVINYTRVRFSDNTSNWLVELPESLHQAISYTITVPAFEINGDDVVWELMNLSDALNNAIYEKFKEEPARVPYSLCVYFEYLPHARADRRFEIGNATPLRRFMNTLGNIFDKIYIEVPHNPDFFKGDSRVVLMTDQIVKGMHRDMVREGSIILLPDAGAVSRFGGMFGDAQIVSASKTRDLHTGKILDVKLSFEDLPKHADVVIFDDICDGGGTFIPIAEQIKKMQPTAKVHLLVVHGIFSKKLKPFEGLFFSVKCRNIVGNFVGTEHINAFNNK